MRVEQALNSDGPESAVVRECLSVVLGGTLECAVPGRVDEHVLARNPPSGWVLEKGEKKQVITPELLQRSPQDAPLPVSREDA